MLKFLLGVIVGLIVGWNLLPQPAWVLRLYDRISDKILRWLGTWVFIGFSLTIAGCSAIPGIAPKDDPYPYRERAMAEIALASLTLGQSVVPDEKPRVGSRCKDCNDPPGECGVGKTGDGRICDRCRTCNGDGRIDDQDLQSEFGDIGSSVVEVPKEITLHATAKQWKDWPSKWYTDRKPFEDRAWIVRVTLEPEGATQVPYFDVQASDGEVFSFFEPLTLQMIEHLETR